MTKMRRDLAAATMTMLAGIAVASGCARERAPSKEEAASEAAATPETGATPVRIAKLERATLSEIVEATGRTQALVQHKVRAPFAGTLTELSVVDGDHVKSADRIGAIVSRDSEAARAGAEEMARLATTPAEKEDADRALRLAEAGRVKAPLLAGTNGVVSAHAANLDDRLGEGDEILTIASTESIVFSADVAQSDLPRVHTGERASIALAGITKELSGTVRGLLAAANPADLTAPVRIDIASPPALAVGLFGTAHIRVGEHRDVPVLPATALLHDDVSGVTRIATIDADARVRWLEVATGYADGSRCEILSPRLAPDLRVIVSGQIGLPEGARVVVQP